jgi:phosphomannomutase/phosphoglucomutase
MRKNDAIYGGEMSAHHYFKDFAYCDSGMLPWLLLTKYLSENNISLKQAVAQAIAKYPCSGEINFTVGNSQQLLANIQQHYRPQNPKIDCTDGISAEFADWRFNLRASNTEPLIRLNIETRKDKTLLEQKIQELTNLIQN